MRRHICPTLWLRAYFLQDVVRMHRTKSPCHESAGERRVLYVFNGIWMTAEFAWQEESISLGWSCRNRHSWHLFSDRHRLQPSQTLHHHQFASNRNSPWSHGTCGHRLTCDEFSVGSCKNLLICLF